MASPTGQGVKINALILETRMLGDVLAVTSIAGGELLFPVVHGVRFDMTDMASSAVDGTPVVRAVTEFNHSRAANLFPMAGKAGVDLCVSFRYFRTTAEANHRRKAFPAMRTRNMNTARPMAGLATLTGQRRIRTPLLTVRTCRNRMHFRPGMTYQAGLGTLARIPGCTFPVRLSIRILCEERTADQHHGQADKYAAVDLHLYLSFRG